MHVEVSDSEKSNFAVVLSVGGRVVKKVYFHVPNISYLGETLCLVGKDYADYIFPNTRIDIYNTKMGAMIE